jgi:hypothetical protein
MTEKEKKMMEEYTERMIEMSTEYDKESYLSNDIPQILSDDTPTTPIVTLTFPIEGEYSWNSKAAVSYLEMALALYNLANKRSEHKHTPSEEEYAFWNRFSDEVNKVLEDHNISELIFSMP